MIKALVVDDIEENLYYLETLLKGNGYHVRTASNGKIALSQIVEDKPDVIISDILMPVMDGFTLCTQCKSDPENKKIPFIFYTATYTDIKDEKFALSLGADAFLLKPIEPALLIKKINETIKNFQQKGIEKDIRADETSSHINLEEYNDVLIRKLEDKMIQLEQSNKELIESEARYRNLFENVPIGLYRTTADGQIIDVNPALIELLDYSSKEEAIKNNVISSYSSPDDHLKWLSLMEKEGMVSDFEVQWKRKNGSVFWVEESSRKVVNSEGHVLFFEGSVKDITSRKKAEDEIKLLNINLEKRVRERTIQLEQVNQELEAFSYSVSHDLRAPLRIMDGFSKILLEEYSGFLDENGKKYLERISNASQKMRILIEDLLKLSRVAQSELLMTSIDLSQKVEKNRRLLEESEPGRSIRWMICPNILADGDEGLLDVVIQNLINNAFKFTSLTPDAQIEFNTMQENGKTIYYVRDNGVGFDKDFSDRLFAAFQRLPSADKFDGTGLGLTIVQRIIHRHGGNIWAESELNKGATFYFTIG